MSATEHKLLEQLLSEPSPERKALMRVVTLSQGALSGLTSRELRYYEIALEGLGMPTVERNHMVRDAIQARRDRIEAKRNARQDASDEAA